MAMIIFINNAITIWICYCREYIATIVWIATIMTARWPIMAIVLFNALIMGWYTGNFSKSISASAISVIRNHVLPP